MNSLDSHLRDAQIAEVWVIGEIFGVMAS